jgi:hypothetical protein
MCIDVGHGHFRSMMWTTVGANREARCEYHPRKVAHAPGRGMDGAPIISGCGLTVGLPLGHADALANRASAAELQLRPTFNFGGLSATANPTCDPSDMTTIAILATKAIMVVLVCGCLRPSPEVCCLQAATLVGLTSRTLLELAIGITRGFMASGISRSRSTCKSPFSRLAPLIFT